MEKSHISLNTGHREVVSSILPGDSGIRKRWFLTISASGSSVPSGFNPLHLPLPDAGCSNRSLQVSKSHDEMFLLSQVTVPRCSAIELTGNGGIAI